MTVTMTFGNGNLDVVAKLSNGRYAVGRYRRGDVLSGDVITYTTEEAAWVAFRELNAEMAFRDKYGDGPY